MEFSAANKMIHLAFPICPVNLKLCWLYSFSFLPLTLDATKIPIIISHQAPGTSLSDFPGILKCRLTSFGNNLVTHSLFLIRAASSCCHFSITNAVVPFFSICRIGFPHNSDKQSPFQPALKKGTATLNISIPEYNDKIS